MTPAGETPFAKDAHFGFSASNLKDWVVEKSHGTIARQNISSVSLKDIREGGHAAVANILESQVQGNTVIINGKALMNGKILTGGDVLHLEPGDSSDFECLEDCDIAVVKSPSIIGDKYLV